MAKSVKRLKFEEAMERLDQIVEAMESGEIGVEESIGQYEEAMNLASHCRKILDDAELRIQKIQENAAGQPETEPFDPPEGAEANEAGDDSADPSERE